MDKNEKDLKESIKEEYIYDIVKRMEWDMKSYYSIIKSIEDCISELRTNQFAISTEDFILHYKKCFYRVSSLFYHNLVFLDYMFNRNIKSLLYNISIEIERLEKLKIEEDK